MRNDIGSTQTKAMSIKNSLSLLRKQRWSEKER